MKNIRVSDIVTTVISFLIIVMALFAVNSISNFFQKPVDADKDGYVLHNKKDHDCNDTDSTIHPNATDIPGDGVDQDCDGKDAVLDITKEDIEKKKEIYKEFNSFLNLPKTPLFEKSGFVTPSIITKEVVINNAIHIQTKGKITKAFLYVRAGVDNPLSRLTPYDSVYFFIDYGRNGGHLLRSASYNIPSNDIRTTVLLFNLDDLPLVDIPYSEKNVAKHINVLDILNVESNHYIGMFVSTQRFGKIEEATIAYQCEDKSDCGIWVIK